MNPMIGEIRMFAGDFAPKGWAICDGRMVAISQQSALFALLGTNYGGDGRVTFGLPDLRGSSPMGAGQGIALPNRKQSSQVTRYGTVDGQDMGYVCVNFIIALEGDFPCEIKPARPDCLGVTYELIWGRLVLHHHPLIDSTLRNHMEEVCTGR